MKRFPELVFEQASTVAHLREEATKYIRSKIAGNDSIAVTPLSDLLQIRTMPESNIFAMNESLVIADSGHVLKDWKDSVFEITGDELRGRALQQFFRLDYLTNDYRMEKWSYRGASAQIAQNFNEAAECYLMFLYCINQSFIPRKDWLVYLSYELPLKPETHEQAVQNLYLEAQHDPSESRHRQLRELAGWMLDYCQTKGWL